MPGNRHGLSLANSPEPCCFEQSLNAKINSKLACAMRAVESRILDFRFGCVCCRGGCVSRRMKFVPDHRLLAFLVQVGLAFSVHFVRADEKPMMKAVVAHDYGAPEMLKFEEVPRPEPKEDEALVRAIASGVNPADPLTLSGKYALEFGTHLPLIPGYDIAGVVEKTGAKVTNLKAGDAVYGYPTFGGGWAEYVTVKQWEVAAKPKKLNFAEAAAVPMAALTAWQALVDTAQLHPGQTILVHGGSGGVGSFTVQIAKARGARVIATASTANQDLLKQLGADVAIDYTKTRFEDVAKD